MPDELGVPAEMKAVRPMHNCSRLTYHMVGTNGAGVGGSCDRKDYSSMDAVRWCISVFFPDLCDSCSHAAGHQTSCRASRQSMVRSGSSQAIVKRWRRSLGFIGTISTLWPLAQSSSHISWRRKFNLAGRRRVQNAGGAGLRLHPKAKSTRSFAFSIRAERGDVRSIKKIGRAPTDCRGLNGTSCGKSISGNSVRVRTRSQA
jgi:hypothetical protein